MRFKALGLGCLAAAVCLLIVLWLISRAPESYPSADNATTSIYALRAVNGELATGAYSRFRWNHPGPMLYELLAPLYALSGRREVSLKWTMLLFNTAVIAALLIYLRRRASWLAVTMALALLPLIYFEQRLLFWAWNPVAPLLPLALAMTLAAGVCAGHTAALPWLSAVVSFLVQSHLGLAPVSVLLATAALVAAALQIRVADPPSRRLWRRSLIISAAVAALLWAVPVIHDLRTRPANLPELARFFTASHPHHSWRLAADIVANELIAAFTPTRELITGDLPASASWVVRAWAIAQVLLLGAAGVWFRRRARTLEAALAFLCIAASVVSVAAVRSIVGDVSDYLVIWIAIIGILNTSVLAAAICERIGHRLSLPSRAGRHARSAIAAYVVVVALLGATRLTAKQRSESTDHLLLHLANNLGAYCDQRHYVRPAVTFDWKVWRTGTGLVLQLYKANRAVAVNDDVRYVFGEPFARTGREPAEFFLMPVEDAAMPAGVTRFTWVTSVGGYRIVQVFRD